MSSLRRTSARLVVLLLVLGLAAAGGFAGWQYAMARRAGDSLSKAIENEWPAAQAAPAGTRERLLAAADAMRAGDFWAAVEDLQPAGSLTAQQRTSAQRFFARQNELRQRFYSVADSAKTMDEEDCDVGPVRAALTRSLFAAARGNSAAASLHIAAAETALDAVAFGPSASSGAVGKQAVAGLAVQIGPFYGVGRDLLTESHTAVEKLLRRARQDYDAGQYNRAAALIRLAAQLSALDPAPAVAEELPDWFAELQSLEPTAADRQTAAAAVDLCQSMAAATQPSPPVRNLIRNAKSELAAQRWGEAYWWTSVALNTLGMSDAAIRTALAAPNTEATAEASD